MVLYLGTPTGAQKPAPVEAPGRRAIVVKADTGDEQQMHWRDGEVHLDRSSRRTVICTHTADSTNADDRSCCVTQETKFSKSNRAG